MENIKIAIGIVIIILSFIYILKNKTSMLDNMLNKTKQEYEKKQALKEKAYKVVDGQADAFDTIAGERKYLERPLRALTKPPKLSRHIPSAVWLKCGPICRFY